MYYHIIGKVVPHIIEEYEHIYGCEPYSKRARKKYQSLKINYINEQLKQKYGNIELIDSKIDSKLEVIAKSKKKKRK